MTGSEILIARNAEVGTWIKDPRAIVEEADSVNSFITRLASDFMDMRPVRKKLKDTYFDFYREWLRWYGSHRYTDIWGKFGSWGNYWDKLLEYKKRANQWLEKFNEAGGETALESLPEKKKEISLLRTALYGGLILGGIYVATGAYKAVK